MNIKMRQPGRTLSDGDLAGFERRLGRPIPSDYRSFLLHHNGGRSDEYETTYLHRYYERTQTIIIDEWFAVDAEPSGRITIEQAAANLKSLLPAGYIPIGETNGGQPILLSLLDNNRGAVYLLDAGVPAQRGVSMVAKTFGEFIDSLKPHEE